MLNDDVFHFTNYLQESCSITVLVSVRGFPTGDHVDAFRYQVEPRIWGDLCNVMSPNYRNTLCVLLADARRPGHRLRLLIAARLRQAYSGGAVISASDSTAELRSQIARDMLCGLD